MIERFTVRSYEKMKHHPDKNMDLVDEAYFNTMDECEKWCKEHCKAIHPPSQYLNFEIHHSLGAKNYRFGIGSGTGLISWIDKDYDEHNFPSVRPWWSIYDVPFELDQFRQGIKF